MTPSGYNYASSERSHAHGYLLPHIDRELQLIQPRSLFDLGCGNGSVANYLAQEYEVVGIDSSEAGIAQANAAFPALRLEVASAYDDLAGRFGQFDAVISLEVIEHVFDPRLYVRRMMDLVRPGGWALVSTPHHGYIKNLALALTGKLDEHFTALWDGGHIKFWSVRTLTIILEEAGFEVVRFGFAGRMPALAKSMIAVARRPLATRADQG